MVKLSYNEIHALLYDMDDYIIEYTVKIDDMFQNS